MNRTLIPAFLIIALTAPACFAVDAQQGAPAPQAIVGTPDLAARTQQPQPIPASRVTRHEKGSPILETSSLQDGIAPQKTQFGDAAPGLQAQQSQAVGAPDHAAGNQCASCPKRMTDAGSTPPGVTLVTQATPEPATSAVKPETQTEETRSSQRKECQSCQRNTRGMRPGQDNLPAGQRAQ